ncbi:hypothetical protein K438DRAFT_1887148, partial [Mycena galopus ATCC 62051]
MSGARGCFNCGGCALSSSPLPIFPHFPRIFPIFLEILRRTSSLPALFLPIGDAADDVLDFFIFPPHPYEIAGVCRVGVVRGRIYLVFKTHRERFMLRRPYLLK